MSVCLYIFLNLKRIETSEQSAGGFFVRRKRIRWMVSERDGAE